VENDVANGQDTGDQTTKSQPDPYLYRGSTSQITRLELRRAAFDNAGLGEPTRTLIEKVTYHATSVTDEDVAAVRAAGLNEDQIFEIVVCAAIGQASRQHKNALAVLASAIEEGKR
jgi:alkylhydroperoxidase family enzyme